MKTANRILYQGFSALGRLIYAIRKYLENWNYRIDKAASRYWDE